MSFEAVIGLEVHAQLLTRSKLFCGCATAFGASPNVHTCEVCLGMPGALPVLNREAVTLAVRAALALDCTVHERSQWARKNYFYPDLPKGYQISQFDRPLATHGHLDLEVEGSARTIDILRIHMEEDAGKNVHDDVLAGSRSYVDFNRGGVPLIEIVGAPQIRSGAEAAAYMRELRRTLRFLDVCDGNLEEGSLRCDANVSIRKVGATTLGTRTELKNINSFRFVAAAIDFEIHRQIAVVEAGDAVVQETRLWDAQAKVTRAMRSKEEAHDYRYFPDPDLPDLVLTAAAIHSARATLPELPAAKKERFVDALGLTAYDAALLTEEPELCRFFEAAVAGHKNAKGIANWILNELLREARGQPLAALKLTPESLAELVRLIDDGTISGKIAKDLFAELVTAGGAPAALVKERGLAQLVDTAGIEATVDAVLAANAGSVAAYRAGKTNILGFLVGQVMKASGGKANPKIVNEVLRRRLG
ncbi:MAG: Asp-tRNA(Asn)/Glu-tRNA(Gln) amidotransferase subunit GatB [Deltaproteobacteria bacterium]|nr:Asp-tRNA(Asn)/Glu-tRNA(Gln) amidotransferase subunit GatB [Deltaproteobacteria bacterium]